MVGFFLINQLKSRYTSITKIIGTKFANTNIKLKVLLSSYEKQCISNKNLVFLIFKTFEDYFKDCIKRSEYMEHTTITYAPLLIIVSLAAVIPIIIKKIKFISIPVVVGEILAGMLIGKSGLNLIEETSWLNFLSTFGFAFLMFLSGLEIDFKLMRPTKKVISKWYKKPLTLAITTFLITLFSAYTISYFLKLQGLIKNEYLMTLILSTTSLGIVVPTLKEKNLLTTQYGQTLLLSSLIADFATMVLITIFVTLYTSKAAYEVLLLLLLFVAFFIFYRMGIRIAKNKIIQELVDATSEIEVRGAFALIIVFIALSQSLGTEIILGAFLAGVIISLLNGEHSSNLYIKLDAIGYGFFVPIFFIMVGANFDIKSVLTNPKSLLLLPILLISAYAVKFIPSLIMKTSYSWRETISSGFLLSSRLSLIIAASAIGLNLGIISKEVNEAVVLVAIITCTFSPLLFNHFTPELEDEKKKKIFIFGVNQQSLLLGQRLKRLDEDVVFLTNIKINYEKCLERKVNVYLGDYLNPQWLEETGIGEAKAIVAANSEEKNNEIIKLAKETFMIDNIIVFTNYQTSNELIKKYGAMSVSPEFATAFMAENLITHHNALYLLLEDSDDFYMSEVHLKNPQYVDKPLRKIWLPGDCLILSILRGDEKIIPHGNNIINQGDLLMIVGSKENVKEAEEMLS